MSKDFPPEHTSRTPRLRSVAVAVALGAAGVFTITTSDPASADAQTYYGNQQNSPDRVIYRNPTIYGPNEGLPTKTITQPGTDRGTYGYDSPTGSGYGSTYGYGSGDNVTDGGWGRNTSDFQGGYGSGDNVTDGGWGRNTSDYNGGSSYGYGYGYGANPGSRQISNDPVVYTNPGLTDDERANIVPQVITSPQDDGPAPQPQQGYAPYPAYCWAMGFGFCHPDAYYPSYAGYAGDYRYGEDARGQADSLDRPQPEISIRPAAPGAPPPALIDRDGDY